MAQMPKDFIHTLIIKTGPLIMGYRISKYNKKTNGWETDKNSFGSVENYDGQKFRWNTDKERDKIVEREKCRWHYFKSFEQYGFKPEEWK